MTPALSPFVVCPTKPEYTVTVLPSDSVVTLAGPSVVWASLAPAEPIDPVMVVEAIMDVVKVLVFWRVGF